MFIKKGTGEDLVSQVKKLAKNATSEDMERMNKELDSEFGGMDSVERVKTLMNIFERMGIPPHELLIVAYGMVLELSLLDDGMTPKMKLYQSKFMESNKCIIENFKESIEAIYNKKSAATGRGKKK